ncbi:MAG: DUF488 domain-containing protein [bacterium]
MESANHNPLTILTVGHSNLGLEALLERLRSHEVALVADVRSMPYSRHNPQFNREPFAKAVSAAGLSYQFLGDRLGGRPRDPDCYTNASASLHSEWILDYGIVLQKPWFREGFEALLDFARRSRTVLLCAEEDPRRCHRHLLLARALLPLGVDVLHLRGHGGLERAELDADDPQRSLF